jgi:hypothetical protein
MSEPGDGRVAVYIDFDNIIISRYDQVHGRGSFMRDRPKSYTTSRRPPSPRNWPKPESIWER